MITIVFSKPSTDLVYEGLERILSNNNDFDVVTVNNELSLRRAISNNPQILIICEGIGSSINSDYSNYFDLCPGLGIIAISTTDWEVGAYIRNVGSDLIEEQIRLLASEKSKKADGISSSNLKFINFSELQKSQIKSLTFNKLIDESYVNFRDHLDDLCEWLDLTLHLYLLKKNTSNSDINIPAWAMSAEWARALLGKKYANSEKEELAQILFQLEKKLKEKEDKTRISNNTSKFITLIDRYRLSEVERRVLLFTLAPEIDGRYANVFGYLNNDLTRRRPTPSLLNQIVNNDSLFAWDICQLLLDGEKEIAKLRLIQWDHNDNLPSSEVGLKLAPEILTHLLSEQNDPSYNDLEFEINYSNNLRAFYSDSNSYELREKLDLLRKAKKFQDNSPIIQIIGNEDSLHWFKQVANECGEIVVIQNLSKFIELNETLQDEDIFSAARVALLNDAILLITGLENNSSRNAQHLIKKLLNQLVTHVDRLAIHCNDALIIPELQSVFQVEYKLPDFYTRRELWLEHSLSADINLSDYEASCLAGTVRFDQPEIIKTLSLCGNKSDKKGNFEDLKDFAKRVARKKIPSLMKRIEPVFNWDDIVLPETTIAQLKQIPRHIQLSGEVFENWGFNSRIPSGNGVAALFSGPSGTGKTMAAQIIARELGVDIYQVDLASTVSKYIGETEKNLENIFNAAEYASAVLLFDEADALFGKRTEVKDAHDRYANVEVAYLLQRVEAYSGLAILTTNFKQNIDNSFIRRLRFVVDFPTPNSTYREELWKCVFPPQVEFAKDVDTKFMARRFELTGGHIQQIAIRAAFSAKAENAPVSMKHIIQATREELIKLGMLNAERNLNDFAQMVVA